MLKFIYAISVVVLLHSCNIPNKKQTIRPEEKASVPGSNGELSNESAYYNTNYQMYSLEGCEYIVVGYGDNKWGSHKGNCKNPIHNK
jgi:hypothetical protein